MATASGCSFSLSQQRALVQDALRLVLEPATQEPKRADQQTSRCPEHSLRYLALPHLNVTSQRPALDFSGRTCMDILLGILHVRGDDESSHTARCRGPSEIPVWRELVCQVLASAQAECKPLLSHGRLCGFSLPETRHEEPSTQQKCTEMYRTQALSSPKEDIRVRASGMSRKRQVMVFGRQIHVLSGRVAWYEDLPFRMLL